MCRKTTCDQELSSLREAGKPWRSPSECVRPCRRLSLGSKYLAVRVWPADSGSRTVAWKPVAELGRAGSGCPVKRILGIGGCELPPVSGRIPKRQLVIFLSGRALEKLSYRFGIRLSLPKGAAQKYPKPGNLQVRSQKLESSIPGGHVFRTRAQQIPTKLRSFLTRKARKKQFR